MRLNARSSAIAALAFCTSVTLASHVALSPPSHQRFAVVKRQIVAVPPDAGATTTTAPAAEDPTTSAAEDPDVTTTSAAEEPVEPSTTSAAAVPPAATTTTTAEPVVTTTTTTEAASTTTRAVVTTTLRASRTTTVSQDVLTITSVSSVSVSAESSSIISSSALPSASAVSNSSSSSTGKTWAIVGGSVGGAILLAALVYVVWRCTQRRFGEMDAGHEDIKWPELQPDGQQVSTGLAVLNPSSTRRTGGAGIGEDDDDEDDWEEKPSFGSDSNVALSAGPGMAGRGLQSYEHQQAYGDAIPYHAGAGNAPYYDPYLGSNAPAHALYPPVPAPSRSPNHFGGAPAPYRDASAPPSMLTHSNSLNGGLTPYVPSSSSHERLARSRSSPPRRMPSPGAMSSVGYAGGQGQSPYGYGSNGGYPQGYVDRVASPSYR